MGPDLLALHVALKFVKSVVIILRLKLAKTASHCISLHPVVLKIWRDP